ncbi:MAG: HAD family hydrolase [Clostridia bacterium]
MASTTRSSWGTWPTTDYDRIRNEAVYVFPGAVEAIRQFKADGRRFALITNGAAEPQRGKIDRFGLANHFDLILIEGEQGMGKPDPRVYQQALITFGLVPSEAVMAGDNWEWDVMGAARVGIIPVWVNPGDKPRPDGGTLDGVLSVRTIAELPDII